MHTQKPRNTFYKKTKKKKPFSMLPTAHTGSISKWFEVDIAHKNSTMAIDASTIILMLILTPWS